MNEDRRMQLEADLDAIRKAREHLAQALEILEANLSVVAPITGRLREEEQTMLFMLFALTEDLFEEEDQCTT